MPLATPNLAVFGTGSATADYNVIGVRPSSGAASTGGSDASDSIRARSRSDIAAPEDGRTPARRSPAVPDPVPVFSPGSGRCQTRRNGRIRGTGIALVGIALAFFFILPLDAGAQTNRSANPHLATETNLVAQVKKNFRRAHARYQNEPRDTEAAWQFARACFDLADVATESAERAEVAEQGIAACRQAIARDPNSAPLHYYLGMNLGQLAQTKGLGALKLVTEMEGEFSLARELDEQLDYAGPDRNLGLLYRDAPALGSIGSRVKARQHLQRATELAPQYPENRLNLIEAYLKWGDRQGARRELKALEELWPSARAIHAGNPWAASWLDWEKRLSRAKKKIEEPSKAIEAPRQRQ